MVGTSDALLLKGWECIIIGFGLAEEGVNGQPNFDVVVNAKTGKQRKGKEQPTSTMIV